MSVPAFGTLSVGSVGYASITAELSFANAAPGISSLASAKAWGIGIPRIMSRGQLTSTTWPISRYVQCKARSVDNRGRLSSIQSSTVRAKRRIGVTPPMIDGFATPAGDIV